MAMIFCAICRQGWRRSASPSWNMNLPPVGGKQLLTYVLHGEAWREE
ncbi:hypothetical protein KCP75_20650 [Salmonella enterica subsp. enterica]|nr:hypothetical protein KCP75_20650 [Salmonella enterica subsp. enterica]